jgi:8-oxo-dGTP diphosphatase
MKRWTLGFVFNSDFSQVLLIHKERPEHQRGKWNGLGGKYEEGESAEECISREVWEESKIKTHVKDWRSVAILRGTREDERWEMDVLATTYIGKISDAQTMTDEEVKWFSTDHFPIDTKHNLFWLVPLCIDSLKRDEIEIAVIEYTDAARWR